MLEMLKGMASWTKNEDIGRFVIPRVSVPVMQSKNSRFIFVSTQGTFFNKPIFSVCPAWALCCVFAFAWYCTAFPGTKSLFAFCVELFPAGFAFLCFLLVLPSVFVMASLRAPFFGNSGSRGVAYRLTALQTDNLKCGQFTGSVMLSAARTRAVSALSDAGWKTVVFLSAMDTLLQHALSFNKIRFPSLTDAKAYLAAKTAYLVGRVEVFSTYDTFTGVDRFHGLSIFDYMNYAKHEGDV